MKLIIAGGRNLTNYNIVINTIYDLSFGDLDIPVISEVVCGCAPGIDESGRYWAKTERYYPHLDYLKPVLPVREFPACWDLHGRAAGPIRNKEMAEYADVLLLIWDGKSKGSANMKTQMQTLKKPVLEVIV